MVVAVVWFGFDYVWRVIIVKFRQTLCRAPFKMRIPTLTTDRKADVAG